MLIDEMNISRLEKPAILEKSDGTRIPIKAEIQSKVAFMSDTKIPIEVDDILERTRGSITDRFVVTFVDVCDDVEPYSLIEPHIQAKIKPERKIVPKQSAIKVQSISAQRVYINSTDNSSNVSIISSEDRQKFEELKSIVAKQSDNNVQLLQLVEEMETTAGSNAFNSKYQEFMAKAANHVTVLQGVAPLLGWLAGLVVD